MRALALTAALVSLAATSAFADATVAGHWKADMGHGVTVDMNVTPDGRWSSDTWQHKRRVREMAGTYTQTPPSNSRPGEMVFTPTTASAGSKDVETDTYTLSDNGQDLGLTSGGDTMEFRKTR